MTTKKNSLRVNVVVGSFAVQFQHRRAALLDHMLDARLWRQGVVDRSKGNAAVEEGGREVGEIGFIQRLPIATMDEHEQRARQAIA